MSVKQGLLGCVLILAVLSAKTIADIPDVYNTPEVTKDVRFDQEISDRVALSVTNFAHDLAVALDTNDFPNTRIFSPLSIMSAMSLLQLGSHGNSFNQLNQLFAQLNTLSPAKVHEEFGWLLDDAVAKMDDKHRPRNPAKWRSSQYPQYEYGRQAKNNLENQTIRVSNGLFVDNDLHLSQNYATAVESVYRSEVIPVDFKRRPQDAKDLINSWVRQNTLGKIPAVLDENPRIDTEMIMASTLYFKGYWEKQFFSLGDPKPFYPDGPNSMQVAVNFMGNGGVYPYHFSPELNCQIIGLPYNGNKVTMYVIQPMDSTRLRLQQLQKQLTGEKLTELISKMEYRTAILVFPKFHVTSKMHLNDPLKKMGIQDIFQEDKADFSLITESQGNTREPQPPAAAASLSSSSQPVFAPISSIFGGSSGKFSLPLDRYNEAPLIFSRFSDDSPTNETSKPTEMPKSKETPKPTEMPKSEEMSKPTEVPKSEETSKPTEMPESEEMSKPTEMSSSEEMSKPEDIPADEKKSSRRRRQALPRSALSLQDLDALRTVPGLKKPKLYLSDIVHSVDIDVNEQGTEAAAATLTIIAKSGPQVNVRCDTPFLILIQHDDTKLPLFYGTVNIPVNY